ncbi:c-type cytochrome [Segetibacter sp. 3557_3]|uniref:c-type cytochrome n=1 Tax=Segetibacter sp. 3557_3 TaxID=2547429 RepID=UPI001058ABE8|nr:cytochrome c [Segetibacter sp. 3557_3]TDH25217.1 c-type cytochrome [Segetibacter sp. 3557_3]
MKKFFKWTGILIAGILILISGITFALQFKTYEAPYPDIKASKDPVVIARGKYLALGPAHCADCHAPENKQALVAAGQDVSLSGGRVFKFPPGELYAPNITPDAETGIGKLSDAELARALRYGVDRHNKALFPLMPFQNLSDEDLTAIISYIRSAPAEKNVVPEKKLNALGYVVNAFLIKPVAPTATPLKSVKPDTTAAYGEYLANNIANCKGCHTNRDLKTGEFTGEPFAGGLVIESVKDPLHYSLVTPNITPDPETGRMSGWTQEQFLNRFRMGKLNEHSVMAWGPFSRMQDNDLKAIYKFLQTVKPVKKNTGPVLIENKI